MGKRVAALLSAAALLLSWPALAQEKIDAPAGQAWIHEGSGFGFAPTADGLKRFEVKDFGKTQSDIAITYREDATGTIVSLYLFRAAVPDVSIWADRAEASMLVNAPRYLGTLGQDRRKWSPLTLWPNARNAGTSVVYPLQGKGLTATGLAVARHGPWLIKLRMSSSRLDSAQIEARMASFLRALALPAPAGKQAPAYQIKPCATALSTAKVTQFAYDEVDEQAPGLLLPGGNPVPASKPYCREETGLGLTAVFRPGGSTSEYVMTLNDGGVAALVRPWPAAVAGRSKPFVSGILITNDRIIGLNRFDDTPGWKQLYDAFDNSSVSFEIDRTSASKGKAS